MEKSRFACLRDIVLGSGLVAFSVETGGDAGVRGWKVWISQYPMGHSAKAANDGNGGDRIRVVDEIISIECRDLGRYFQLLGRVAESIVGQGGGGV